MVRVLFSLSLICLNGKEKIDQIVTKFLIVLLTVRYGKVQLLLSCIDLLKGSYRSFLLFHSTGPDQTVI